jgi:effector-binding domain-containing protein
MRNFATLSTPPFRRHRLALTLIALGALMTAVVAPSLGQTAPKPGPVESNPLPPPAAAQSPGPAAQQAQQAPAPAAPSPAPATPAPRAGGDMADATLGPPTADPASPDELDIKPKAEAYIEGEASWDDALKTIRDAQKLVRDALGKAGVKIAGRPLTRFVKTGDDKFSYQIGYPVELPSAQPSLSPEVKLGTTPSGPAVRFTHHGAYDDIDGTYEAITIDLDAKGIEVNEAFVEEYLNDTANPSDGDLQINIYVFKKTP